MAEAIFKTHDANFAARPASPFDDGLLFGNSGFFTAPYGNYWRFMKKLCITELFSPRQIERSRAVRHQEITRLLRHMIHSAAKTEDGDEYKLLGGRRRGQKIRNVTKKSFGLVAKMCLANSMGPFKKLGFWLLSKEANELTSTYDELLEKLLKEHEEKANNNNIGVEFDNKDLMDILLKAYHDENAEFKITTAQIKAFFLIARDEIESIVGTSRLVEETDIPKLNYVQAIAKEAFRLHPTTFIRVCHQDCKINGFDIPRNIPVAINAYSIGRDPTYYGKTQMSFALRGEPALVRTLAYATMNITIASIIQCMDLKVIGKAGTGAKLDMEEAKTITLSMASPIRCPSVSIVSIVFFKTMISPWRIIPSMISLGRIIPSPLKKICPQILLIRSFP
ncbi:Cytochrome P450 [Corchorus capsularis]|uniref:Cytochrome P450 n=1 Tax=Corchorus capsularis TaxID=210143 RepID=A0A1R3JP12_COCAP|nr:Cytochrome P450 [Corchorus capsularis]